MTPQHEYGYLYNPPDWKEGDECLHNLLWITPTDGYICSAPRRRLIKPGDGYRILGLDESLPQAFEALFVQLPEKWIPMRPSQFKTVKEALAFHSGIRAIRVPVVEKKDEFEEWWGQFPSVPDDGYEKALAKAGWDAALQSKEQSK